MIKSERQKQNNQSDVSTGLMAAYTRLFTTSFGARVENQAGLGADAAHQFPSHLKDGRN